MLYKFEAIGTVGNDAVQPQGQEFITFSIASNYKNKAGEQVTIWTECVMNNVKMLPYITKGKVLFIDGFPKSSHYTDKNGNTVSKLTVNVNKLEFCGEHVKKDTAPVSSAVVATAPSMTGSEDQDLPF